MPVNQSVGHTEYFQNPAVDQVGPLPNVRQERLCRKVEVAVLAWLAVRSKSDVRWLVCARSKATVARKRSW